jgi:hypothetical protein
VVSRTCEQPWTLGDQPSRGAGSWSSCPRQGTASCPRQGTASWRGGPEQRRRHAQPAIPVADVRPLQPPTAGTRSSSSCCRLRYTLASSGSILSCDEQPIRRPPLRGDANSVYTVSPPCRHAGVTACQGASRAADPRAGAREALAEEGRSREAPGGSGRGCRAPTPTLRSRPGCSPPLPRRPRWRRGSCPGHLRQVHGLRVSGVGSRASGLGSRV